MDANTPTITAQDREDLRQAPYAPLTARPASKVATDLCDAVLSEALGLQGVRSNKKRRLAFSALVPDLLERDPQDRGGWLGRPLSSNSFNGGDIGYRSYSTVFWAAEGSDLIEVVLGASRYVRSAFTAGKLTAMRGQATRFRATERLRKRFADAGITRDTWADHFARMAPIRVPLKPAISLRAASARDKGETLKGRKMRLDRSDPRCVAALERMERINAFLAAQTFEPFEAVRLQRVFNNGDSPVFAWNQGGRIFGPHTNLKKTQRSLIRINGEPTVEVDLRACHLTILSGLGHLPGIVLPEDPYVVEGIPREVVKRVVTIALSYGKRHTRWSPEAVKDLSKEGINLSKEYPIRKTTDAVLKVLPFLAEGGDSSEIGMSWADLQFVESEIILSTMETLAFEHGVPSLSVHDSLIVPIGSVDVAKATLSHWFQESVGLSPWLD